MKVLDRGQPQETEFYTAIWALFCSTPSSLSVFLYHNHWRYAFVVTLLHGLYKKPTDKAIITCVCTVPGKHIN